MPFSLFLLGALVGGVVGGFICFQIGREEREDLELENEKLRSDNKRLWRIQQDNYRVVKMQRDYINQIDKPYLRRKEGSECDPFTDF